MKDVKFQLHVTEDEARAIAEYRWKQRIGSRAEAVRQLIAKGLEAETTTKGEHA